ncbi:MAG: phosphatase [Eubacterium sp.]|jgi:putative hydrolase
MKDLLDSHTHSIVSGHAYSSMNEMIAAAVEKKLSLLAITEHAPAMDGSCQKLYFKNLKILPRKRGNLWTLFGAELNILNKEGEVDLDADVLKEVDVAIASIHPPTYHSESNAEDNTTAYIRAMSNPCINIIGHPDDGRYPVNYGELVRAAKAYHVLLEVNNSSFLPTSSRTDTRDNCRAMLEECMRYQAPVIINSDAHADFQVGAHEEAWKLIHEMEFPEELIANTSLDLYFSYLNYNPLFTL